MRIRTVKPEFWAHRMHETISETAALVALGLLNIADDDGRFLANPRYIESIIFPVRAPVTAVADCLEQLERAGYWKPYEADMDGRRVRLGVIVNFLKHQVISRPRESRLASPPPGLIHDDSVSGHGSIHDDSRYGREGKGKGREGKGEGRDAAAPAAPTRLARPVLTAEGEKEFQQVRSAISDLLLDHRDDAVHEWVKLTDEAQCDSAEEGICFITWAVRKARAEGKVTYARDVLHLAPAWRQWARREFYKPAGKARKGPVAGDQAN